MKAHLIYSILFSGLLILSCNRTVETNEEVNELIEITKDQFLSEKMELGEPQWQTYSEILAITGNLVPSANGTAHISSPIAGIINRVYSSPGQEVKRGQPLLEVGGNELIDMQKDFAETSALLNRLSSEYVRVKELSDQKIGSQKELIQAESSYKSEMARYMALKMKLEKMGFDVSRIEAGSFYLSFTVKAPIKGFITVSNAAIGLFTDPQSVIMEIIDTEQLRLKFPVFEKDMDKVKEGQRIRFTMLGNKNKFYNARLSAVGKVINTETRAVDCFADLENADIIRGIGSQYVEGHIVIDSSSVFSLPSESLLKADNEHFVLKLDSETEGSYYFIKTKIKTGSVYNDFVELEEKPENGKFLVSGVFNIPVN